MNINSHTENKKITHASLRMAQNIQDYKIINEFNEIRLHLVDRYVNGYVVGDKIYEEIVTKLFNIMINTKFDSLQQLLHPYLGRYSTITAQIYRELSHKYLYTQKYKYKKHPDIYEIYDLIGTYYSS